MKKRKEFELGHLHPSIPPSNFPRKSRRLDADLCTIMEEEDPNVMHLHHEDPAPATTNGSENERALVLYDPTTASSTLFKSPSSPEFPIVVNADLIPGLKDYLLSWGIAKADDNPVEDDEMKRENSSEVSNSLAVVPWIVSRSAMACEEIVPETRQFIEEECEMMDTDEPEVNNNNNEKAMQFGDKMGAFGASSPWQQHCMIPNVLQNTSTPIHWC